MQTYTQKEVFNQRFAEMNQLEEVKKTRTNIRWLAF